MKYLESLVSKEPDVIADIAKRMTLFASAQMKCKKTRAQFTRDKRSKLKEEAIEKYKATLCPHGMDPKCCRGCGAGAFCIHDKVRAKCVECNHAKQAAQEE